ncbi:MAG: NifB/NifX family molybdenum-iron cluster-binding protein [Candidatus Aminicenantales bacterium]
MKVAIASDNGYVSAHFGRCSSYTMVEIERERITGRQEIANPGHSPGFLPGFLAEKGVNVIIAGGMGPRAQGLFAERNIQTITGVQGKVDEVIEKFIRHELEPGRDLCDHGQGRHPEHSDHAVPLSGETTGILKGKICVTAKGRDLDAEIDPNFGRARYLIFVDPETLEFESLKNLSAEFAHGAGIQAAQFVSGRAVSAVLTGQVGPNARQVLDASGIKVITAEGGTIREAIARLKRG